MKHLSYLSFVFSVEQSACFYRRSCMVACLSYYLEACQGFQRCLHSHCLPHPARPRIGDQLRFLDRTAVGVRNSACSPCLSFSVWCCQRSGQLSCLPPLSDLLNNCLFLLSSRDSFAFEPLVALCLGSSVFHFDFSCQSPSSAAANCPGLWNCLISFVICDTSVDSIEAVAVPGQARSSSSLLSNSKYYWCIQGALRCRLLSAAPRAPGTAECRLVGYKSCPALSSACLSVDAEMATCSSAWCSGHLDAQLYLWDSYASAAAAAAACAFGFWHSCCICCSVCSGCFECLRSNCWSGFWNQCRLRGLLRLVLCSWDDALSSGWPACCGCARCSCALTCFCFSIASASCSSSGWACWRRPSAAVFSGISGHHSPRLTGVSLQYDVDVRQRPQSFLGHLAQPTGWRFVLAYPGRRFVAKTSAGRRSCWAVAASVFSESCSRVRQAWPRARLCCYQRSLPWSRPGSSSGSSNYVTLQARSAPGGSIAAGLVRWLWPSVSSSRSGLMLSCQWSSSEDFGTRSCWETSGRLCSHCSFGFVIDSGALFGCRSLPRAFLLGASLLRSAVLPGLVPPNSSSEYSQLQWSSLNSSSVFSMFCNYSAGSSLSLFAQGSSAGDSASTLSRFRWTSSVAAPLRPPALARGPASLAGPAIGQPHSGLAGSCSCSVATCRAAGDTGPCRSLAPGYLGYVLRSSGTGALGSFASSRVVDYSLRWLSGQCLLSWPYLIGSWGRSFECGGWLLVVVPALILCWGLPALTAWCLYLAISALWLHSKAAGAGWFAWTKRAGSVDCCRRWGCPEVICCQSGHLPLLGDGRQFAAEIESIGCWRCWLRIGCAHISFGDLLLLVQFEALDLNLLFAAVESSDSDAQLPRVASSSSSLLLTSSIWLWQLLLSWCCPHFGCSRALTRSPRRKWRASRVSECHSFWFAICLYLCHRLLGVTSLAFVDGVASYSTQQEI